MAYLTHSAYQVKLGSARASHASRLAGAAAAVALVAGLYAAASYGGGSGTEAAVSSKGDRLAMTTDKPSSTAVGASTFAGGVQTMSDSDGRVVFHQDQAQRTTTVVRGATIPLSNSSPYPADK